MAVRARQQPALTVLRGKQPQVSECENVHIAVAANPGTRGVQRAVAAGCAAWPRFQCAQFEMTALLDSASPPDSP